MEVNYLEQLTSAAAVLIAQAAFGETIRELQEQNRHSREPFAWSVIDLSPVANALPELVKSAWLFVLKQDVPSGCHYHPNSIQHMVMLEGEGESQVDGIVKQMTRFDLSDRSETAWYVIGQGVPHEFFPTKSDMVVLSFHTCAADELEEIACGTGESRLYEGC